MEQLHEQLRRNDTAVLQESWQKRPLRQDAWSEEDDQLLAEITLRYIREGSTQTKAFEEAAERLNRTPGACAFRWATVVKHEYQSAIEGAKRQSRDVRKQRMQKRRINSNNISVLLEGDTEVDLDAVVRTVKLFKQKERQYRNLVKEYQSLQGEYQELKEENECLKHEIQEIRKQNDQQDEDYKMLLEIVNRARKMSGMEESSKASDVSCDTISNV